jgi:two-component system chemotaxis response regulator CheB
MLASAPEIEVVGTARDGAEAIELAGRLKPDVVTLDVEMPGMSGLDALPVLLNVHQLPVVMVSALTQEGADVTLAALELGAFDFLPKPGRHQVAELQASRDVLLAKILAAAQSRGRGPAREIHARREPLSGLNLPRVGVSAQALATRCVVIGISTGGPQALSATLPNLVPPLAPILIVQHMPAQFTFVFAERLDRKCNVTVKQAEDGERVVPDQILIAPGGRHMTVVGQAPQARIALKDGPAVNGHRPSIDMLFQSAARAYESELVGILMTGMGRDGVAGCKRILAAGGRTFGQDEATSAVYGMNKAAYQENAIQEQFSLEELPAIIDQASRAGD